MSDYKFSNNGVTNTGSAHIGLSPENSSTVMDMFKVITKDADFLLKNLLIMEGGEYMLNREIHNGDKEFDKIISKLGLSKKEKENLKMKCKDFFFDFVKLQNGRSLANILFETKGTTLIGCGKDKKGEKVDGEYPTIYHDHETLRSTGLLPLKFSKNIDDVDYKYLICYLVHNVLSSFIEKRDAYNDNKKEWESKLSNSNLPQLERMSEFLNGINHLGNIIGWNGKKYIGFIKKWTDEESSMYDFFVQKLQDNPKYKFGKKDQFLYGYEPEFLNYLFHDFRDLWHPDNLIGKDEYVDLISGKNNTDAETANKGAYHWLKDFINISSFDAYGKMATIGMGNNLINYSMNIDKDGKIIVNMDNIFDRSKPIVFNVYRNSYFRNFKIIESDDKKGIYKVEFSTSNNGVIYEGYIKSPSLRFATKGGTIKIDFPISDKRIKGGREMNTDLMWFLNRASPCSTKNKEVNSFIGKNFVGLAIDRGINPLMAWYVAEWTYDKDGKAKIVRSIANGRVDSGHNESEVKFVRETTNRIVGIKSLVWNTVKYRTGGSEGIDRCRKSQNGQVDLFEMFDIDYNNYLKEVNNLPYDPNSERSIIQTWVSSPWKVKDLVKDAKNRMVQIKTQYHNAKDKEKYITTQNRAGFYDFLKIEMEKQFTSLQRMFSGGQKDICKNNEEYRRGLRRRINLYTSSVIMSLARKFNVDCIFLEDLDSSKSSWDDAKKNSLKDLWSTGGADDILGKMANKYKYPIVKVNSHLTSLVDNKTGKIGYRDPKKKSNLYVERGKKIEIIDSDENAAINILKRGISKHIDIREFFAEKIEVSGKTLYRISNKLGKQRMGSLYYLEGNKEILFGLGKNGEPIVCKRGLCKKERLAPRIAEKKSTYLIMNGSKWMFRHEAKKIVETYKDRYCANHKVASKDG